MLISSEFFILVVTIFATVTLGYPLILWRVFSRLPRPQKEPSPKQLERKLLSCHQNILNKIEEKTEKILAEQLTAISGKHSGALSKLEIAIKSDYDKNRQELKAVTGQYLDETRIALLNLVKSAEKRVNDGLTEELKTTLAELKDYKERRLKKIDEEIAAIVERTIYRTLGKGLSLEDQIDIIYESLAEAKEEGFFGKDAN